MASLLNLTEFERLALWDKSSFKDFLPSIVYLFLCVVVGVVGNGIVIYIYGLRLHKNHDGRYFIPYLAVVDLLAVIFSTEHHIVIYFYPVTYKWESFCKLNCYVAHVTTVCSLVIILTISIQRYLKVCTPYGRQMTLFWRRCSLLISFVVSVVFAIPTYFIYGLEKKYNQELNITGYACVRVTTQHQSLFLVYSAPCLVFVITEWIVLIVLYVKVARVIFQQSNSRDHDRRAHKITLMFMTISIIYILTFLPRMITSIVAGVKADFWDSLSVEAFDVIDILHLLYIVNHVANPFVYACMDVKFWTEFKKVVICSSSAENLFEVSENLNVSTRRESLETKVN